MCSRWEAELRVTRHLAPALLTAVVLAACGSAHAGSSAMLRVCSDPNNLPFSNDRQVGFENRLAELVAGDLHMNLAYTWRPQRRGFIRNTLNAQTCDLVVGMPVTVDRAWTTIPYYRSTYVFVTRARDHLRLSGLDDPRLRKLRIGVHLIGDDYANTPAATSLARRGIVSNVVGYTIYGDYSQPDPPAALIHAVANGDVDVAIAWGPLAGYFGARESPPLELTPVTPQIDLPFTPFVFDIGMAVRRRDTALHAAVEEVLRRRRSDIQHLLADYGVPQLELRIGGAGSGSGGNNQ
jgi:mxaJ protein